MTDNKTLLFYINSIHEGGAQRVMLQLAGRFAAAGWRPVLVTSFVDRWEYPVPPGVERLSLEGEQIVQSALRRNLSRIRALRALIVKYRPAALISFMGEPNFRALLAARGLPVKTVVSVRNDPEREYSGRLMRMVGRRLLPLADGCVFQTEQARAWFPEALQKKSAVIMNQVSEAFYDRPAAEERNEIAAVGRLSAQKNHALLIRAFSRLPDAGELLVIYGEGELRSELEALIERLGLSGRVLLPGQCDDIPAALGGAKFFVLSSDYEGMPNALLEAMALGLPCIATDCPCGGPASVIRNGENGLLVPVGDEQALSEAMAALLSDGELRRCLARNAKQAAEGFRPDAVFRQWEAYVVSILDEKGAAP